MTHFEKDPIHAEAHFKIGWVIVTNESRSSKSFFLGTANALRNSHRLLSHSLSFHCQLCDQAFLHKPIVTCPPTCNNCTNNMCDVTTVNTIVTQSWR